MSDIIDKISTALFKGEFGFFFPRIKTRIKKMENGDGLIAFREKTERILLIFKKSTNTMEIQ